jgi:hypothetical protein
MSGKRLSRAERMIICCAGLAGMDKAELDEILAEAGFRPSASGTHACAQRGAAAYRDDPGFLLRQIRSPRSFTRIEENRS